MGNDSIDTVGKIISKARGRLRLVNADSKFTDKFIYSVVSDHISWLLKRESDKMKLILADYIFQTRKCVDIIEVPAADEACGVKSKCTVRRTRDKLPKLHEDAEGVIIKSVYTIDGSAEFTLITVQEYMRKLENPNSKYDSTKYCFYNNGYLYFPTLRQRTPSRIKKIMVKGYFVDSIINECELCQEDYNRAICMSRQDQPLRLPNYILGELMNFISNDFINILKVPTDVNINKNENQLN